MIGPGKPESVKTFRTGEVIGACPCQAWWFWVQHAAGPAPPVALLDRPVAL